MKKNIHPTMNPTIFVDVSTNDEVITSSTLTSDETKVVDGVTYQVVRTDITSYSHPFFTGEVRFVDERGTVERFKEKMKAAQEHQAQVAAKQAAKKGQKTDKQTDDSKSYRDLLREQQDVLRKQKPTTQEA